MLLYLSQVWSWQPLASFLPKDLFDPSAPASQRRTRVKRVRTPRLATKASEHGVNFAALDEFLGHSMPTKGRSVIMQIASSGADGRIPQAIPQWAPPGMSRMHELISNAEQMQYLSLIEFMQHPMLHAAFDSSNSFAGQQFLIGFSVIALNLYPVLFAMARLKEQGKTLWINLISAFTHWI